MKKVLLLITAAFLLAGCESSGGGIKPKQTQPIKPIALSTLATQSIRSNVVVKTEIQVLDKQGEIVTIPLVSTNEPAKVEVKADSKGKPQVVSKPEKEGDLFFIVPDVKPAKSKEAVTNITAVIPKEVSVKKKNTARNLFFYYVGVGIVGTLMVKGWKYLFGKKKIKSKFLQEGNFPQSPTGGSQ